MLKIIKNIKIIYNKINYICFRTNTSNKCCRRTKAGRTIRGNISYKNTNIGAGCKWTQASRDNSGFLTKSGAVSDYERVK